MPAALEKLLAPARLAGLTLRNRVIKTATACTHGNLCVASMALPAGVRCVLSAPGCLA